MAQEQPRSRMERFIAWMNGEGGDADFAASATAPIVAAVPVAPQPPRVPETDPRLEAALAELAQLKAAEAERFAATLTTEATAFATRIVAGGRALPVEQDHLAALYRLAAADDAAHGPVLAADGTSTTRVAALAAWQEARPASPLLEELVPVRAGDGDTLVPLTNQERTEFASARQADAPMTEQERIAVMAMTPTGRAELQRRGIPIPAPQRT